MTNWTIHQGDTIAVLTTLPAASIHTCITSPPYFALRDYGVEGQIGLEATPATFLARLVAVFAEVRRVLHPSGTLWVNMGDSYANDTKWGGSTSGKHVDGLHGQDGPGRRRRLTDLPPKSLMGMPWRLAFALQDDGWILRSEIIWHKPSCMPESVRDRPTRAHEHLFLFAKQARYYYDAEAIREENSSTSAGNRRAFRGGGSYTNGNSFDNGSSKPNAVPGNDGVHSGRNARTVWSINPEPFTASNVGGGYLPAWEGGDHYAAFPTKLVEPCILAGTSAHGCCPTCLAPWERQVERSFVPQRGVGAASRVKGLDDTNGWDGFPRGTTQATTTGWRPTCTCPPAPPIPATVLDPFSGTGTTVLVATRHGRRGIGIELSPEYTDLSRRRIVADAPLLEAQRALDTQRQEQPADLFSLAGVEVG